MNLEKPQHTIVESDGSGEPVRVDLHINGSMQMVDKIKADVVQTIKSASTKPRSSTKKIQRWWTRITETDGVGEPVRIELWVDGPKPLVEKIKSSVVRTIKFEKRRRLVVAKHEPTMARVVKEFLRIHEPKHSKSTNRTLRRMCNRFILPLLGNWNLSDVDEGKVMIVERYMSMKRNGKRCTQKTVERRLEVLYRVLEYAWAKYQIRTG